MIININIILIIFSAIFIFGKKMFEIKYFPDIVGEDGVSLNQFSHPFQIVSKTDDFILVADAKNNRIQKWKL